MVLKARKGTYLLGFLGLSEPLLLEGALPSAGQ